MLRSQRRRLARLGVAFGLGLVGYGLLLYGRPNVSRCDVEQASGRLAEALERWEVSLHRDLSDITARVPAHWKAPPASVVLAPMDDSKMCQLETLLRDELGKYPDDVLKTELRGLLVVSDLRFAGALYAGTYFDEYVVLNMGEPESPIPDVFLAETLHHELSSVFMATHPFPALAWKEALPEGFRYADDWRTELEAVRTRQDQHSSASDAAEGFLSRYGRTSQENDVNTYAQMLFSHPRQLRGLVEKHPAVRKKVEVLAAFYGQLDERTRPRFDEVLR